LDSAITKRRADGGGVRRTGGAKRSGARAAVWDTTKRRARTADARTPLKLGALARARPALQPGGRALLR